VHSNRGTGCFQHAVMHLILPAPKDVYKHRDGAKCNAVARLHLWEWMCKPTSCCPRKLYVRSRKLLPNIRKLTDAARRGEFFSSHMATSSGERPEFRQFPPHCLKGTPGAELVPKRSRRISFAWKTIAKRRCGRFTPISASYSGKQRWTFLHRNTPTNWWALSSAAEFVCLE